MTRFAALAMGLAAGCSRGAEAPPLEDLGQLDVAVASTKIRALVVDCPGLARSLDTLAASRLPARSLIGLVDEAVALGRAKCRDFTTAIQGATSVHRLARAAVASAPDAALRELGSGAEPALAFRRADLLESLGRPAEALVQLGHGLARDPDPTFRARELPLQIAAAAAAGKVEQAVALVESAPIEQRVALANRLVALAPVERLAPLGRTGPLEVAVAAGDRLEREQDPRAALPARSRATLLAPDDADLLDAFARSLAASDRLDEALAAWDRAAALAPAQPAFHIAPVRVLAAAGKRGAARARVDRAVALARAQREPEPYVIAANVAVAAGDPARAVTLMREARSKRPRDGRLAFELALRLVDASDRAAASELFVELLVCGAHGRPWHRHELAGKLLAIASDAAGKAVVVSALDRARACPAVQPDDLATYTSQLRAALAQ